MTRVRRRLSLRAVTAAAVLLPLAACVSTAPLQISDQFEPPAKPAWATSAATPGTAAICHVKIAGVQDLRPDPQSLGTVANQAVRTSDSISLVRSSLASLSRDPRIVLDDQATNYPSGLTLNAELIKAYVINITGETRSANVVLRVRYEREGRAPDVELYRGTDNGLTWGGGQSESQSSFNIALAQIIDGVHRDALNLCASPP